MNLQTALC